jgi:phospholipase C
MDNRRTFLKKVALLSGAAGMTNVLPESIQRALAINPAPGSSYLDAEHIVLLMQENRSFDHCFGTLRGVRGFNDPRAITLPDKNAVWLQSNKAGDTYTPFRLDIKDTSVTWMGSLPHSRSSQIDAWNKGKYDQWIDAKKSDSSEVAKVPLTMGYYTREDLPFYYALADAFTVCDQHFCSSLTPTDPNRLFFWSGTVREKQTPESVAYVRNNVDFGTISWETFPELLEQSGISWKVYQNEISIDLGMTDDETDWLSNFGDNPLEYFLQYNAKLSKGYNDYLQKQKTSLTSEADSLKNRLTVSPADTAINNALADKQAALAKIEQELETWDHAKFDQLPDFQKAIHQKAFAINDQDEFYRELSELTYQDESTERQMKVPKGDVLYQFRKDVQDGKLPTVSWIVAPNNFSDHPDAPWYGAWYVSEVMDILTQNPEVWKKTIFILTYDENDGYFDHVPPFVFPKPGHPETGITSPGINDEVEYVTLDQELKQPALDKDEIREGPIGLGYRVPLVIASPWSRGGYVCSEVFDHSSSLQFLEDYLNRKFGKQIRESNITNWRRTVSGNLTSVFRQHNGGNIPALPFISRDPFVESIHNAKFKAMPSDYRSLTEEEINKINREPSSSPLMPKQEKGIRPSCPIPYELYADGKLDVAKKNITVVLEAGNHFFGKNAVGSGFNIYAPGKYLSAKTDGHPAGFEDLRAWAFAVTAGDQLHYSWPLESFENGNYHLRIYGPNGFYRELKGDKNDPGIIIQCLYNQSLISQQSDGNILLRIANTDESKAKKIEIIDHAYQQPPRALLLEAAGKSIAAASVKLDLRKSYSWYDFSVKVGGATAFERRFAGHVETGKDSYSDPLMGGVMG